MSPERSIDGLGGIAHWVGRHRKELSQYGLAQAAPVVAAFIATLVFARVSTAADWGTFALGASVATTVVAAGGRWLEQGAARHFPALATDGVRRQTSSAVAGIVTTAVTFAVLGAGAAVAWPTTALAILGVTAWAIGMTAHLASRAIAQSRMRAQYYLAIAAAVAVAPPALGLLLVLTLDGLAGEGVLRLLGYGVGHLLAGTAAVAGLRTGPSPLRVAMPTLKRMWVFGGPMSVWLVAFTLVSLSDRWVLDYYTSRSVVGEYSAAYQVAVAIVTTASAPIMLSIQPRITRLWDRGERESARRLSITVIRLSLWATAGVAVVSYALGSSVLSLLLGDLQPSSSAVFPLLAAGICIWQVSLFVQKPLELKQDMNWLMGGSVLVALANVVGSIVLVPRAGAVGAACATLGAYSMYAALVGLVGNRRYSWGTPVKAVLSLGVGVGVVVSVLSRI